MDLLKHILMAEEPSSLLRANEQYVFSLIPELALCKGFQQNNPWHIYDVYEHILKVVDLVPAKYAIRLAALFHDVGKPAVYRADEQGIGHFYGHWERSLAIFKAFSEDHALAPAFSNTVAHLIYYHDINFGRMSDKELADTVAQLTEEELLMLFAIKRADLRAQNPVYHGLLADYDLQEARALAAKGASRL